MAGAYRIDVVDWRAAADALRQIRERVFVQELGVPAALEWDGRDTAAVHALARDHGGIALGCGRLLSDGQIGRLAVLPAWRGRGVGAALLDTLIREAERRHLNPLWLNAQHTAVAFYERFGFRVCGEPFLAAGIPHTRMERGLR